ncbi:MerR family transcriptional regulator [Nocardia sp. NPDC020380]|uniref:MerR family transcriptional regulator n=1 Tax=Nocardia sp. NPDC020380 TaxID=3364309 RepID=UPI003796310D
MLTIGQLADAAGVTVHTVRCYHQRGILPEPERDDTGYQRYDAQAVVDLIRIRTLADAGVPLTRIDTLLRARPTEFASAERVFLPVEVVDVLERMRALDVSERMVRLECEAWILMVAIDADSVPQWVRQKNAAFDDPALRDLYLTCDQAFDWRPGDPRVDRLIDTIAAWDAAHPDGPSQAESLAIVLDRMQEHSPAWQRILDVLALRARRSG